MAKPKFSGINKRANNRKVRIAGDVRQTQLISTFGIGSIVDFVRDTVIIAGVDDWDTGRNEEDAERRKIYCENLQALTGKQYFLSPKVENNRGWIKSEDIPSYIFPEMLYCPRCKRFVTAKEAANDNPNRPNKCCLSNPKDGGKCTGKLVASRFVVVCENGHIEDFPYSWWIHGDAGCQDSRRPRISMFNIDDRSDIESLWVKCDNCGKLRTMATAFSETALSGEKGYPCNGNHPHLRTKSKNTEEKCTETLKTRLRSSSGIYYPVTICALQIPPWSKDAVRFVEDKYDELSEMVDPKKYLSRQKSSRFTLEQLLEAWEIVQQRKDSTTTRTEEDIYQDEYKVLIRDNADNYSDEGDYSASPVSVPYGFERFFKRITVINKLTVIEALKGFTRLKSSYKDDTRLAPLSMTPKDWLPAVELRGEGIFIQFSATAISQWKNIIGRRYAKMTSQLAESYLDSFGVYRVIPEYVLLHTFAHMFIRQLANECGYSASSIKERIYSTFCNNDGSIYPMHGILIYLASSDCDGSLGGLISIAEDEERLRILLLNMINKGQWCSADPLCAASTEQGFDSLNYAACHDCVLLPETSCELMNVLLDRISVVGTPDAPQLGFMNLISGESEKPQEHHEKAKEKAKSTKSVKTTTAKTNSSNNAKVVKGQETVAMPNPTASPDPYKTEAVRINELKTRYQDKQKIAHETITKRFPPPQMSHDRFFGELDNWNNIFNQQIEKAKSIIDIASDKTERATKEIEASVNFASFIVDKIEELTLELTINLSQSNDGAFAGEVDDLMEEMQRLVDSVKEYK